MDIYICTDDVRCGRALALEARAAGFVADYGREAAAARLTVRDLDFRAADACPGGICFSRDEERLRAAARQLPHADVLFLLYPFDLTVFRAQLAARLAEKQAENARALTLNTASRRASGAGGEVRLSRRECALLAALGTHGRLSREDAAALFGRASGNVVDVYVCYLRKKLGDVVAGEVIRAERGAGYALADGVTVDVLSPPEAGE